MNVRELKTDILVVGAGIAGISTALEAAETGYNVILIEKNPYVGGRVVQLNQYFPKLCPPTCGMEINIRRLRDNPRITLFTLTDVEEIKGGKGSFTVKIKVRPTYINENYADIDKVAEACSFERKNDFDFGMSNSKVIYRPYNNAYPARYVLDKASCSDEDLNYLKSNFKEAIDLEQEAEQINIKAGSIVWATGWTPYEANNLENLSYGKYPEVLTNMELERLTAANGPYGGNPTLAGKKDGELKSVAFVQCAGSRDEKHLEYCSSVCCLASIKQAHYIRELYKDCEVHIYYIDIRTPGVFEEFFTKSKADPLLFFHRGKVAKVIKSEDKLIVEAENTLTGQLFQSVHDLVVLATGMKPNTDELKALKPEVLDRNHFVRTDTDSGIVGCGVCTRPKDVAAAVQESTGAAMKAIHNTIGGN